MDVEALTAFLAPFLPYLAQAGHQIAQEAGQELGGQAWEHAKRIWAKLSRRVEEKPAAREAAWDLAVRPDDERARGALELQLEKLLAEDVELAEALGHVWQDAKSAGVLAVGSRSVAIGGNATGSTLVTGDHNTIGR
jgi:hypothetical protein